MQGQTNVIETIDINELLITAIGKKKEGYRLAQICSAVVEDKYHLSYSFAKEYDLINYRVIVDKDVEVPSVTPVYASAFLYENEMQELFGVNMEYISRDYHNKLYRIEEETPFLEKEDK